MLPYKLKLKTTLNSFQSAITPSIIQRRIEGTIQSPATLFTVPSIPPYEKIRIDLLHHWRSLQEAYAAL